MSSALTPREFPVLWPMDFEANRRAVLVGLGCPKRVPWSMVEPHEQQAIKNHSQTLERLAKRGGLDPHELASVLMGQYESPPSLQAAVSVILERMPCHAEGPHGGRCCLPSPHAPPCDFICGAHLGPGCPCRPLLNDPTEHRKGWQDLQDAKPARYSPDGDGPLDEP